MLQLAKRTAIALILSSIAQAAAPPRVAATASVTANPPHPQSLPATSTATAPSSDWKITLNVQLDISKADRSNSTVGLNCAATLSTQHDLTAHGITSGPVDATTYHTALEAHPQAWPSQTYNLSAAMANGEYHGMQTVPFHFGASVAAMQTANGPFDTVVVGCRLMLNNVWAVLNPYAGTAGPSGPEVLTSGAIAFVQTHAIQWQTQ